MEDATKYIRDAKGDVELHKAVKEQGRMLRTLKEQMVTLDDIDDPVIRTIIIINQSPLGRWQKRQLISFLIKKQISGEKRIYGRKVSKTLPDGTVVETESDVNRQDIRHGINELIRLVGWISTILVLLLQGASFLIQWLIRLQQLMPVG